MVSIRLSVLAPSLQNIVVSSNDQSRIDFIIYEVVMLRDIYIARSFLRTVAEKPPEFFATHVKCLCIPFSVTVAEAIKLLSVCTGLNSLACWLLPVDGTNTFTLSVATSDPTLPDGVPYVTPGLPSITSLVTSLHLRSLCARLCIFSAESNPDFTSPLFQNITHLDIADRWETWMTWSWTGIGSLIHLSHLSLQWEEKGISHTALKFLSQCKNLRVCIFYIAGPLSLSEQRLGDDPRVVVFPYSGGSEHWETRVRGEANDFVRAEQIVRERQLSASLCLL